MNGQGRAAEPGPPAPFRRVLGLGDAVAMNLVAVVALRWITRGARLGAPSIILWVVAWLSFFVPLASAVSHLSSRYPEQGGIYAWTRRGFGPRHAVLCGWCLWVNNLFYFPSLLLFAGTNALIAVVGPSRAASETTAYSAAFVLGSLALLTLLNVRGLGLSKWVQNVGSLGTFVPAALLVAFGALACWRFGSATSFAPAEWLPRGETMGMLSAWSAICFAFSGFEVTSMVGEEVKRPRRTLPLAILIAGLAATAIYVAGSVAVLAAIPAERLAERSGVAEAIELVAGRIGVGGLGALTAALLAAGAVAQTNSWIAAAGRVPFAAAADGLLPRAMATLHARHRTPHVALLLQGAAAGSIFLASLLLQFGSGRPTLQDAYDILVNLTILAYFVPYLYLFASLLRLGADNEAHAAHGSGECDGATGDDNRRRDGELGALATVARAQGGHGAFQLPGGAAGRWVVGCTGLASTGIAIALVFVPPAGASSALNYEVSVVGQAAGVLGIGWLLARRGRAPSRSIEPGSREAATEPDNREAADRGDDCAD